MGEGFRFISCSGAEVSGFASQLVGPPPACPILLGRISRLPSTRSRLLCVPNTHGAAEAERRVSVCWRARPTFLLFFFTAGFPAIFVRLF